MSASDPSPSVSRRRLLASLGVGLAAAVAAPCARSQPEAAPAATLPQAWSDAESLPLWSGDPPGAAHLAAQPWAARLPGKLLRNIARPELKVFRPRTANGRALLVMPGGAYAVISVVDEGLRVAERMTAAGYTVFVLVYRLPGEGWSDRADVPLQDAQRAMRLIRARAARSGFDPQKVAAVGFSAGGHLAASLATAFADPVYAPRDDADRLDARPAATGLIYPVIALDGPYAHRISAAVLLGPQPSPELVARRSPAQRVTRATPPVFLTHAVDDRTVPMQNSVMMLEAMQAAQRPVEAHFFPQGGHGFGLGPPGALCAAWPDLFLAWLDQTLAGASSPA